jgi:hypothetical protein
MALSVNTSSVAALSAGSTLINSLSNLLLASPQQTQGYQPQNAPSSTGLISLLSGPPSLLFHYEGEQKITLDSDITDHFIEDNTAIQDQIALKPIIVTTQGFIGELNNVPPPALALLQQAANVLTTIPSYLPGLSITAQLAYDNAFAAYQLAQSAVNAAVSAVSSIGGNSGESVIGSINGTCTPISNQNKQQTMFQQLFGYWQTTTLFTIQTPWAVFQNMAILHCEPVQDAETRMITTYAVTFKQINVASTANGPQLQTQSRLIAQSAPNQANGTNALSAGPSLSTAVNTQTANG